MAVEEIKPYSLTGSKKKQVEAMFDNIASTYDSANHVLSFGIDKLWRNIAIKAIRHNHAHTVSNILDVATGTGDLALAAYRKLTPCKIVGCDISEQMMDVGKRKVDQAGLTGKIEFVREDCSSLSFRDNEFDVVMSAFALRNFNRLDVCLSEMHRVLAEDGCIVVIDLCAPRRFPMKHIFALYQRWLMPFVGKLFAHDQKAFRYLPASMVAVDQGKAMADRFKDAGFNEVTYKYLPFAMCCMYIGKK